MLTKQKTIHPCWTNPGEYNLLVNVGDTSYADDYQYGHNAYIFDEHFRNVESHAAYMPFMSVPGNHDSQLVIVYFALLIIRSLMKGEFHG